MSAEFKVIDTEGSNPEEAKRTESVARGLADGHAFNFLEFLSSKLRSSNQTIFILLPKIKEGNTSNSWIKNGTVYVRDLISAMKQDGSGKILNDKEASLNPNGVGRPFVDSLVKGGALIDIPTALTVLIRGISEEEGDFDASRYNSEVDIFRDRLAMRVKEGGYSDVVTIIELEFNNLIQVDSDNKERHLQIDFTGFKKGQDHSANKDCIRYVL
jgi:hypothetical protein